MCLCRNAFKNGVSHRRMTFVIGALNRVRAGDVGCVDACDGLSWRTGVLDAVSLFCFGKNVKILPVIRFICG